MTRFALNLLVIVLALGVARTARAEDDVEEVLTPDKFDPKTCTTAPPETAAVTPANIAPPVTWTGFEVKGALTESDTTIRALFEPTMRRHRAMTDDARDDVTKIANSFGYHLLGLGTRDTPQGTLAVIDLSPLPIVRRIEVDVKQDLLDVLTTPLFEDEIKRRMRLRVGSYVAWKKNDRQCQIYDEQRRIEEYLRDEGYFEARVTPSEKKNGRAVVLKFKVRLNDTYEIGQINIAQHDPIPTASDDDIRKTFRHKNCVGFRICYGTKRFNRADLTDDLQAVVQKIHTAGFPAVRVRTDFDPLTSFDRRSKKVKFTITIDTRRRLDVKFEGIDIDLESELRGQLTFDQAASSDDVEAAESAKALTAYLQTKGFFDARVTWTRESLRLNELTGPYDQLIFRIDMGQTRQVRDVAFVGASAIPEDTLREVIGTRSSTRTGRLFGQSSQATAAQLSADVDAIVQTYRREGFREARVRVGVATSFAGLGSAAMAAALLATDQNQDLYVRFTIDEGQPTMLNQISVVVGDKSDAITTPEQRVLCTQVLADLADLYGEPQLSTSTGVGRCVAVAANLRFKESLATDARDQLRDKLYGHGRPRAKVSYESRLLGPRRIEVRYTLTDAQPLTIGKVVIRGNFRTTNKVIAKLLNIKEGEPLTKDVLADGARRLRNTGLFDAVNVAMPDLDNISEGSVNAVVEIAERYDYTAQLDLETGYSSYNGIFATVNPAFKNLFGRGMSFDLKGTIGIDETAAFNGDLKLKQLSGEGTLKLPQWLSELWFGVPERFAFQTELTGFHRRQDTPRFGVLTTDGVTLSLLRTWQRQRIGTRAARAITFGPHYDFRLRDRSVDVLRPLGADDDQTQVPISTRTGSIGAAFEWEQRTDRHGVLSPLAPEAGFRWELQGSIASNYLAGQDTFLKVSAAGTKYWPFGDNLVLRADLRYDEGFPLGGAVLLPEVERFFAGGDSTVRGYEDDRLATEIIQVGVPPLGNLSQIRILPAGGNIRVMSSLDAQLRIWKLFATAVFIDAGMITNQWTTVTPDDIRPSVGIALFRITTPFGSFAVERAIPLRPQLGDNPRGRFHVSFAARAQF